MSLFEIALLVLGLVSFLLYRFSSRRVDAKNKKTGDARLNRIKKISFIFQWLLGLYLLFGVYWVLAFLFGWPPPYHDKIRIAISDSHIYASPSGMPPEILALWLVKMGLCIAASGILFALFWLYGKGILFSSRNILFIRLLGYCTIIDWVVDDQMQSILRDVDLSMTPLFVGLVIIFVAWIMDEGRKIQEEQTLTV